MTRGSGKEPGARSRQAFDKDIDAQHMRRAIELAKKYRGRTAPNPIVGCVIVDASGEVIAEGAHKAAGKKHAEVDALDKLGGKAPGATMYVNLEPCTHQGRTPPCAPAVKQAGLARVVIGTEDPIPGHGGGIEQLRRAGIQVSRAIVDECDDANRAWLMYTHYGRPAFTLKAAMTLDGKIATVKGQSKWITGEPARAHVHHLRDIHDAVLVGVGTVIADDPWLSSRIVGARDPMRIVVDSKLRTPVDARLLPKNSVGKQGPRTIIATTEDAPAAKEKALVAKGAEVWRFRARANGSVPIADLAYKLGDSDAMTSVLVEGGGQIHASFLEQKFADEIVLYVAPKAVGGPAPGWVGGKGLGSLMSAHKFEFIDEPVFIGEDLMLRARHVPDLLAKSPRR